MRYVCIVALLVLMPCAFAQLPRGEYPLRQLGGTKDPTASDGKARTRDRDGTYCWWTSVPPEPGFWEVHVLARTLNGPGTVAVGLFDRRTNEKKPHGSRQTQVAIDSGAYKDYYVCTVYYDGTYGPRLSDWSSAGLMVDYVYIKPVAKTEVRDLADRFRKVYYAPQLPAPPTIDGNLAEYSALPPIVLADPEHVRVSDWRGPSDLSATFYVAWDSDSLYLAVAVNDDDMVILEDPAALGSVFKYDSVQFAVDTAWDKAAGGYSTDDYEYGLAQTANGPMVYRWCSGSGLPNGRVLDSELAVRSR